MDIQVGDFVKLDVRERPFHDERDWEWEVVAVTDLGISVRYWLGASVIARRDDVALTKVRGWRKRA